jgi:hypothetical protein
MEREAVEYSPKWVGAVYFSTTIYGLESQGSTRSMDFYNTWSIAKNFKSKMD